MKCKMKLIALIYKKFVDLRNWLYDRKKLTSYRSKIATISVGNITVGGTGKTPFVIYLIRFLKNQGLSPLIISRGYKRTSRGQVVFNSNNKKSLNEVGDEPFLMSLLCPKTDIIIKVLELLIPFISYSVTKICTHTINKSASMRKS